MKKTAFTILTTMAVLGIGCSKQDLIPDTLLSTNALSGALQNDRKAIATLDIGIGDPSIKYFGRWDFSNSSQYLSYWGGAYFKVGFTGTSVKVKVGNTSNFYAKIDNGPWVSYIGASGTIDLTPVLLSAGTHLLSVAQGKDYDYVFNFRGLVLDNGAGTTLASTGTDIIEYIGDSITAGFTNSQANVSDYAWVVSELMGAEHTQIAYPGISLLNGYGVNQSKIGMDVQYFKMQSLTYPSSPNWNFSAYTPKIIVINLGQNDQSSGVPDADFQSGYITFLTNIRTKFANAEIFVMRTFTGVKVTPTLTAVNARIAAGDNKVHFVNTAGWLIPSPSVDYNDGVHPSLNGHVKAANLLRPYLSPYLGTGTSYLVSNADVTTGWVSANTLTVNTGDKKEGAGSLQSTGAATLEFQRSFPSINPGVTAANGSIDFWYYVSDVTKFGSSNQIELGSGGTSDLSEYNWDIGPLTNGWNHITKTFATAGQTGGIPDLNAINWFRVYHEKTGSVITKLDAIKITK